MLSKEDRDIFNKLLDYLGVELRLRCVNGGPPDRNNASNNGLFFYSKELNHRLLEKTIDYYYNNSWNVGDEKNAARFLFKKCIDFIEPSTCFCLKPIIHNPFFGCANLEEAAIRLDLLIDGA